jgi:hypothetical protein
MTCKETLYALDKLKLKKKHCTLTINVAINPRSASKIKKKAVSTTQPTLTNPEN